MAETQRIKWLDALKLFTVFFVVWGHMIVWGFHFTNWEDPLQRISALIRMPLLMMVSGFFGVSLNNRSFQDVLLRKGRQLLLPAFTFGIIYIACSENWFDLSLLLLTYWFLKTVFFCSMLYYLTTVKNAYKKWLIILTLIISQFPFQSIYINNLRIWWLYPCFVGGAFVKEHFENIQRHRTTVLLASATTFLILALIYNHLFANRGGDWVDPYAHSGNYALCFIFRVYKTIMGICGSLACITFAEYLSHRIPNSKIGNTLCKWGKYTLGIYCLHMIIGTVVISNRLELRGDYFFFNYFVTLPLISVLLTAGCLGIIKLIHYSKWGSFLLLGEKPPF